MRLLIEDMAGGQLCLNTCILCYNPMGTEGIYIGIGTREAMYTIVLPNSVSLVFDCVVTSCGVIAIDYTVYTDLKEAMFSDFRAGEVYRIVLGHDGEVYSAGYI